MIYPVEKAVCARVECILLLLGELFYICLLGLFSLQYYLSPVSLLIMSLDFLSIIERGIEVVSYFTAICSYNAVSVSLIYLYALILGTYRFISIISS